MESTEIADGTAEMLWLCHKLGEPEQGMAFVAEGNASARLRRDSFLVKTSGANLASLERDELAECEFRPLLDLMENDEAEDTDVEKGLLAARLDDGPGRPSVEALLHAYLLSLPGKTYAGHTHPTAVCSWLASACAQQLAMKRICPDEVVCCDVESVFMGYAEPGVRLARKIREGVESFRERHSRLPEVALLQNHGIVTIGANGRKVRPNQNWSGGKWWSGVLGRRRCAANSKPSRRRAASAEAGFMRRRHYEEFDLGSDEAMDGAFQVTERDEIFAEIGIQFLPFNTLYELWWGTQKRPEILAAADGFLNITDYFNYLSGGARKAEESLASTTQMVNPRTRTWSGKLTETFGLPRGIFPEITQAGDRLGELAPQVASEVGAGATQVIATCSHDTAAAVAAVPCEGAYRAYISSGTWSLVGMLPEGPLTISYLRES